MVLPEPDGGGSGPVWNGQIKVDPNDLVGAAPGFANASDAVGTVADTVSCWTDASIFGLTDPAAGGAWNRMAQIWSGDLAKLSSDVYTISTKLASSGQHYQTTDDNLSGTYGHGPH